ncbi:MAG: hypothetical protein HY744_18135 [Deltaproteobacteria bacterium]|nr:hypothetical protein [Deltaproteobacteria bacterium]
MAGTSSGGDGGEGAALVPEIIDENLVVDCTLEAPEDPVSGGLTAQYDNKKGASPATATLLSCQLVMDAGPNKLTWSFDATPAQVAVEAGALETVEHVKTPGSGVGSGIGEPCDYCFKSWHLAAKWSIDGEIKSASSDPEGIFCEQ